MLEATPGMPWGIGFKDLLKVESNMRWRYYFLQKKVFAFTDAMS
jgi:hypothetical protein